MSDVMFVLLGMLCVMLYLAIGVFLCELCESDSVIATLFWPILLLIVLIIYVTLWLPCELANWVKEKFDI